MWIFSKRKETQASTAFFAACVLLLNLPNFLWLESRSTLLLDSTEFVERLLLCLLLTAVFLTLFTRPWRAWLVLWLLCLWWQPLALGVRAINGMPINATLVGMAMATSPGELRNLAAVIPWAWFAFLRCGTWLAGAYCEQCPTATGAGAGGFEAKCFFSARPCWRSPTQCSLTQPPWQRAGLCLPHLHVHHAQTLPACGITLTKQTNA